MQVCSLAQSVRSARELPYVCLNSNFGSHTAHEGSPLENCSSFLGCYFFVVEAFSEGLISVTSVTSTRLH